MIRKVKYDDVRSLIKRVFATDVDLYERRQHSENKTLDGLVDYAMKNLYDGYADVDVYSYGDEYGFFAVYNNICRSFGIKKEHRDKKELFWDAIKETVGRNVTFIVWSENSNAIRFFNKKDGKLVFDKDGVVVYTINLN